MTWNYRIMKKKNSAGEFEFGIHEVYYDEEGKMSSCTLKSLTPVCSTAEDLKFEMLRMMDAFDNDTLDYKAEGK